MNGSSVLLRIESVLAFDLANFEDRKSNSGFDSVYSAMPTDGRWFHWKVF